MFHPHHAYETHIPTPLWSMPGESTEEFLKQKKEIEIGISLAQNNQKFSVDPINVTPGRKFTYVDNKYFHDVDVFDKAFNLESGTGIPKLNRTCTSAQKYWKKRVCVGNASVAPWRERECKDKRCDHRTACSTNPIHVVMDRVPNQKNMLPEDEIVPLAGEKRKREEIEYSPKKKRAVNAWIAYRMYHQSLFKAVHHLSEVSGKIQKMYETVPDKDKSKWSDIAKDYTRGRDSFPGASRAWLSGMMASLVSKAGLSKQTPDDETEVPAPPLVELPSTLCPATLHTPHQIAESKKRARENNEPEFDKVPKRAKLILKAKKRRLGDAEPPQINERRIKKTRVLKGDTFSDNLGFDTLGYDERFGPLSEYDGVRILDSTALAPESKMVSHPNENSSMEVIVSTERIFGNIDIRSDATVKGLPADNAADSDDFYDSSESIFSRSEHSPESNSSFDSDSKSFGSFDANENKDILYEAEAGCHPGSAPETPCEEGKEENDNDDNKEGGEEEEENFLQDLFIEKNTSDLDGIVNRETLTLSTTAPANTRLRKADIISNIDVCSEPGQTADMAEVKPLMIDSPQEVNILKEISDCFASIDELMNKYTNSAISVNHPQGPDDLSKTKKTKLD